MEYGMQDEGVAGLELRGTNPVEVAMAVLEGCFQNERGPTAYAVDGGEWKVWDGEKWEQVSRERMEDYVWVRLGGATVPKQIKVADKEITVAVPYRCTRVGVGDVVRAMEAIRRLPEGKWPRWMGEGEIENGQYLVSVRDGVCDVRKSAEAGGLVWVAKDQRWMDDMCLPVTMKEVMEGGAAVYEEKMKEWGSGDANWTELSERFFGASLMTWRGFARGLLQEGKVRGGKGTKTRLMARLMGYGPYWGVRMGSVVGEFGLDGSQRARLAVVGEVASLAKGPAAQFGGVLKNCFGLDPVQINVKHMRQQQNVVLGCAWVLQANEIPEMPDKGGGVLNKLLILPYENSWLGKEDVDLDEKLWKERGGVVRRLLEGAARMVACEGGGRWPRVDAAEEVRKRYEDQNNPADAFLGWGFRRVEDGFVSGDLVWDMLMKYQKEVGGGWLVPRNRVLAALERDSGWNLKRWRMAGGGERGLRGLMVKG